MRQILFGFFLVLLFAGGASARCTGNDLRAALTQDDPETAARLMAEAAAVPNGEGRLWRVEKNGVAASYLFGTFHVADAVDHVPNAAWQALDAARIAVFEVTLGDEARMKDRMASDPGFVFDPDARPFSERMGAGDLDLVRQAFRERGVSPEVAPRLRPWMQMSLLTFPPCQIRAVQSGARMLDVVMAERAVAAGIPERGLEEAVVALESLSKLSEEDVTRLIIAAGRSGDLEEDVFITNLALYAEGQIALIDIMNEWLGQRYMPDLDLASVNARMKARLLEERNANWMPAILGEVEQGNAFIAVGALHLVGESGLVALLERAGYRLTRVD